MENTSTVSLRFAPWMFGRYRREVPVFSCVAAVTGLWHSHGGDFCASPLVLALFSIGIRRVETLFSTAQTGVRERGIACPAADCHSPGPPRKVRPYRISSSGHVLIVSHDPESFGGRISRIRGFLAPRVPSRRFNIPARPRSVIAGTALAKPVSTRSGA